ncbi:hypothetical protein NPIL_569181 [Nephila pilipes]|uniref:Uncharacterized protein n=1 Tax=Nephila pilipes TaxID=299642 RepID=A0A8X6QHK7_NEPPI|nr:hypothetical protein NPIL_569181 [Nephila pilipes]
MHETLLQKIEGLSPYSSRMQIDVFKFQATLETQDHLRRRIGLANYQSIYQSSEDDHKGGSMGWYFLDGEKSFLGGILQNLFLDGLGRNHHVTGREVHHQEKSESEEKNYTFLSVMGTVGLKVTEVKNDRNESPIIECGILGQRQIGHRYAWPLPNYCGEFEGLSPIVS